MNPTISIIIPVYNQEKYLSRCLDSVLAQTFTDFEVLCVNDHSTDSTAEILKEYAKKDSRIVLLDDPGKGVSDARNFGIDNAKGEYIGFVDSDDFIQPQMYEFLFRAITENNCNMVTCRYEKTETVELKKFEYHCRECNLSEFVDFYNYDFLAKNEMVISGVWSKLIQSDFLKKNASFENYKVSEDALFCAKLWSKTNKKFLVDVPLYVYYTNKDSTVHNVKDWNFIDPLKARYYIYKEYKKNDILTAESFLFRGFSLAIRCKKDRILKEKESYKTVYKYFFIMLIPFLRMKSIGIKQKLIYIKRFFI